MPRTQETESLKTLKGLIKFAITSKISHFKYLDFEFNLSELTPLESRVKQLETEIQNLREVTASLQLKESFGRRNAA